MCSDCHRDLTTATALINGTMDRHSRQTSTTELQVASEALRDCGVLDRMTASHAKFVISNI